MTIPYGEIPGFPQTTVIGHGAELVAGTLGGKEVLVQSGRFHLYEGHDVATTALPVRVFASLGINTLILTNAAGGIRRTFSSGTVMLIADHINLTFRNPLIGPVLPGKSGFPTCRTRTTPSSGRSLVRCRGAKRIALDEGVYIQLLGPQLRDPGRDPDGGAGWVPMPSGCPPRSRSSPLERVASSARLLGGDQSGRRHLTDETQSCRGDGDCQSGAARAGGARRRSHRAAVAAGTV